MIRRVRVDRRMPESPARGIDHPVVARVLGGRGAIEAPNYQLQSLLAPNLAHLEQASELLADAIDHGQRVLVVGDFDADGATGTALAVRGLRGLGANDVHWRMPDRIRHGYGLSPRLARECLVLNPDVLVTVDQGISSHEGVDLMVAAGVRVIITDHHLPGMVLPNAHALVNPNLPNDPFPSKHLAGVGVMFYLLIGLRQRLRARGRPADFRLDRLLDLVALGTVADLVLLDENNRRLVYQGLQRIRARQCQPGVTALLEVAGRNLRHVGASDLGFIVGPRLNAAGRLDDISIGIQCLLSDDEDEAFALAKQLDHLNRERQTLQSDMIDQAEALVEQQLATMKGRPQGLCLHDANWHPGVVGLVASKLCERLQRPIIAMAPAEPESDEWKGSCRSPQGVHMRDLLVELDAKRPGLMDQFGGHARAAGLSIQSSARAPLADAFSALVADIQYPPEAVLSDGALSTDELVVETAQALSEAGPWGQGWAPPLFDGLFTILERRVVGQKHLKLSVVPVNGGPVLDAIAFGAGEWCFQELPNPIGLTYRLEVNRWRGRVTAQLNIQHWIDEDSSGTAND
ncbi:MAG: single-stranded-DNA-specific exonuclease RecJ [Pseudomonadota bacterium]